MITPTPTVAPLIYLALTLLQYQLTPNLHSLTVAAISWTSLYATLYLLSRRKQSRFPPPAGLPTTPASPRALAVCILAATICTRAIPGNAAWAVALVPAAHALFRGPRNYAAIAVSACAFLALFDVGDRAALVLGLAATGFFTAGLVKVEEVLNAGNVLVLGREVAAWCAIGFAVSAVAMENALGEWTIWQGAGWEAGQLRRDRGWETVGWMVLAGVMGAGRLVVVPELVGKWTAVSVGVLEVAVAVLLLIVVPAAFSIVKLLAVLGALGGVTWWFADGVKGGLGVRGRGVVAVALVVGMMLVSGVYVLHTHQYGSALRRPVSAPAVDTITQHPIPVLIKEAEDRFTAMVNRQSKTLAEAVAEYKRRYNMPPPPNFDKWFAFAQERNVPMIDDYDMIYHSLRPFWGIPPQVLRRRVREGMGFKDEYELKSNRFVHVYIRDGHAETAGQGPDWQKEATKGMLENFMKYLPDLDLPFNIHDEPRVVAGFDNIQRLLKNAAAETGRIDPKNLTNAFTPLSPAEILPPAEFLRTEFNSFAHQSTWTHAVASCPPNTPARFPYDTLPDDTESYTLQPLGFISNTTASSDVCLTPSLSSRHGFFDRPNSLSIVQRLYPVFSQSKVSSFHDILYPSPWYWYGKVTYPSELDPAWEEKTPQLYWRGSTTGGFSRNGGWKRQHRQRVVRILESTNPAQILKLLPNTSPATWKVASIPRAEVAAGYNVHFSGVGQCDAADCAQQEEFFNIAGPDPSEAAYKYKYLLDLDGNAFSGRYHAFLESRSVVFKMAVFREWSDEWLQAWVHYVPVSLEMAELDEIMRWVLDNDSAAKRIAEEGRSWAKQVLRKEVLETWFFRLLIE